jgi:uncharacterized coiled-coil protein SlyX
MMSGELEALTERIAALEDVMNRVEKLIDELGAQVAPTIEEISRSPVGRILGMSKR